MVYLKKNQKLKAQILFIFKADIEESAGHCLKEIISQQNKNNNKNYINGKKPQERFNNRNNNNQATTKKIYTKLPLSVRNATHNNASSIAPNSTALPPLFQLFGGPSTKVQCQQLRLAVNDSNNNNETNQKT